MTILIQPPANTEELALFLEKMNASPSSHIGYCGEGKKEILDTLLNEFSDMKLEDSFIVAYTEDQIVGAIGFDADLHEKTAEVWGPFIEERDEWDDLAGILWGRAAVLLKKNDITTVSFFLNQSNTIAKHFVSLLKGVSKGNHLILNAVRGTNQSFDELQKISSLQSEQKADFLRLHKQSFPGTYYRGEDILDKLNNKNQLLTAKGDKGELTGYVYIEASPRHGEGKIEYIAVSPGHRKKGVGALLVKAALNRLFEFSSINEIALCVKKENEMAVNLYTSAGFDVQHELVSYQVEVK
jgi:ribosomal protein S18 acetylase RimI-like enzyme